MTAAIIPLLRPRTLLDCVHDCDVIALAAKYAGDALTDAHDFEDAKAKAQAVRQLREIAAGAAKIIAEIERRT
jgi:hypothetical protein